MKRRGVLGIAGATAFTTIAGCLDFARGTTSLELAARPVHVPPEALQATGYELRRDSEVVLDREFEVGGTTREAVVTNVQMEYTKGVEIDGVGDVDGAVFTAVATPSVSVLGQEFNPLGELSTDELVERVQRRYENVRDVEHIEGELVVALGDTTLLDTYAGTAEISDTAIDINMHVTRPIAFEDDLVVSVGVHPAILGFEAENVRELVGALEPTE